MQIGTFTSTGFGYTGEIETMTLRTLVTLEPIRSSSEKAPDFRLMRGTIEIGVAFKKTSEKGHEYLSVVIDDPAFAGPIWASLFIGESECPLVWDRPRKKS